MDRLHSTEGTVTDAELLAASERIEALYDPESTDALNIRVGQTDQYCTAVATQILLSVLEDMDTMVRTAEDVGFESSSSMRYTTRMVGASEVESSIANARRRLSELFGAKKL